MSADFQPSNSDLGELLESNRREIHEALKAQNKELSSAIQAVGNVAYTTQRTVVDIQKQVNRLDHWKIKTEVSREAVEKYKASNLRYREERTKMDVLQALLPFLIALTALAYGLVTYLGRAR